MVEKFLPSMRALVANRLHDEGLSQGRIASLLGITQASVSMYLSGRGSNPSRGFAELGVAMEEAEQYAAVLAEDVKKNPVYAVGTLYSIWTNLLGKGLMCFAHRKDYPFLAECEVCMHTFGGEGETGSVAIDNVSRAVSIIESSDSFVKVMPEVSVNIAYASGKANSLSDVVAIPGRIVKVRGRARSFLTPEYGASTHLAKILLAARSRMKKFYAAINLRYDEKIDKLIQKLGLKALRIGGEYPRGVEDPVEAALRQRMAQVKSEFDVLVDVGGSGVEPNLYLFGMDSTQVANLAIRISKLYAAA